jgi:hypothetical protein
VLGVFVCFSSWLLLGFGWGVVDVVDLLGGLAVLRTLLVPGCFGFPAGRAPWLWFPGDGGLLVGLAVLRTLLVPGCFGFPAGWASWLWFPGDDWVLSPSLALGLWCLGWAAV